MPTTNAQRVERIVAALAAHAAPQIEEGVERKEITEADRAQDLLTDLMHFCDARGMDFDELLYSADRVYRTEATSPNPLT